MQSKFVFITATMVVVMAGLIGGTALPAKAAGEDILKPLVISAVQITGGTGRTSEDYIELFNPNSVPFNLKDYRLVKRTATATTDTSIKSWTSDTFIPSYSFYLWANLAFSGITKVPDLTSTATLADNNGVAIRKGLIDTGELVDSLSWGTTTNGFNSSGIANPSGEQSVVRDSLFGTSTYSLQVSNPRNSTIQQLPMDPVDPSDDPPVLADDSLCAIADPSRVVEPNSTIVFGLEFKNNGTTEWTGLDHTVLASDGNNLAFPAESVIGPGQNWITSVELVAPLTEGLYSYQWQMANNGIGFGSSCVLSLTVQPVIPVEDPPPTDDPPVEDPPPIEPPPVVLPTIKITEILPNPKGKDAGRETIELYNYGAQSVVVDSWVLDNILPTQDLSSKAFTFSNLTIEPNQYFAITVPSGKFVLNNAKGGVVTLFDGEEQVIDSVSYSTKAPEGKSYANINGTWKWLDPSFGIQNFEPTVEPDKEQEESTKKEPNKEKTTVTTRAKTKVASKTEKSLKTKTATKTSVKSSKAKAVVKKAAKATAKKAKALDSKTSETNKRPSNKPKTKSEAKSEPKPEAQPEKTKSSGAAGPIAIAIASLGAGGLAVYRFGMGGGL